MNASGTGEKGVNCVTLGRHRRIEPERIQRGVCVCGCARASAPSCVYARACMRDVFAIYTVR